MREGNIFLFSTHNTNKCIFSIFGKGNKEWCPRIFTECPLGLSQVLETLSLVCCSLLFTQWDKAISCGWLLFLIQWTQIGLTSKKLEQVSIFLLSLWSLVLPLLLSLLLIEEKSISQVASKLLSIEIRNQEKYNSNDDYLEEHTVPYWETPDHNTSLLTFWKHCQVSLMAIVSAFYSTLDSVCWWPERGPLPISFLLSLHPWNHQDLWAMYLRRLC